VNQLQAFAVIDVAVDKDFGGPLKPVKDDQLHRCQLVQKPH
jgi:hypothetical protein